MALFNILAGIASLLGLAFSIAAFVQARRAARQAADAAKAARDARDALVVRTITEVLDLSSQRAEQLFDLIGHSRYSEASLRAADLMPLIAELQHRRGGYLRPEELQALSVINVQLVTVRDQLAVNPANLNAAARRRILSAVQQFVIGPLYELVARAKARVDEETFHAA